jgi:hypothetical protein
LLFLPVIQALNQNGVEHIVVGGLAVILHGHTRLTTDLDLVVRLTPGNAAKAVKTLVDFGFAPRAPVPAEGFADAAIRKQWIDEKGLKVFSFYKKDNPLFDVDLFVEHPMAYEELHKSSVVKESGGVPVRICGLDHLIQLKERAGRPKDQEDLRILRIIKNG